MRALVDNNSVIYFSARCNSINSAVYDELATLVDTNKTITQLDVDQNRGSFPSLCLLADAIEGSSSLLEAIPFDDMLRCVVNESTCEEIEVLQNGMMARLQQNRCRRGDSPDLEEEDQLCHLFTHYPYDNEGAKPPAVEYGDWQSMAQYSYAEDGSQPLFGTSLENLDQVHVDGWDLTFPAVLIELGRCLQTSGGRVTKGIFRLTPSRQSAETCIRQLRRARLDENNDPVAIAHILKRFLRELPHKLFAGINVEQVVAMGTPSTADRGSSADIGVIEQILETVAERERQVLRWLFALLADLSQASALNHMTAHNLGVVFGPILFDASEIDDIEMLRSHIPNFIAYCIEQFVGRPQPIFY